MIKSGEFSFEDYVNLLGILINNNITSEEFLKDYCDSFSEKGYDEAEFEKFGVKNSLKFFWSLLEVYPEMDNAIIINTIYGFLYQVKEKLTTVQL